ncbi:unnamed protein product [Staurois parvus]|uniref:Uncharacterized protein n=1 Tax=Staurois parvus TaxID=386267 RepID=A0ABN9HF11_9NEOB|nr:unnamed protein product [Staurois parvus]
MGPCVQTKKALKKIPGAFMGPPTDPGPASFQMVPPLPMADHCTSLLPVSCDHCDLSQQII